MEELNANKTSSQTLTGSVELKESRTGALVPVIDGAHLHSIYNPDKEAQAFAENFSKSIQEKNSMLVLGLGFGYHIKQLALTASKYHGNDWNIVVYEPNFELIEKFEENGGFQDSRISVVHANDPHEVFERLEFIMFLAGKPAIIRHETSFNLNKNFFKKFLTFKASASMTDYEKLLTPAAKNMFPVKEGSLDNVLSTLGKAGKLGDRKDFAFFLLDAVVQSASTTKGKQ